MIVELDFEELSDRLLWELQKYGVSHGSFASELQKVLPAVVTIPGS